MKYFEEYVSNTLAGTSNQRFFLRKDSEKTDTSRTFYKIFAGGELEYSILFSNSIDSTFSDGTLSTRNYVCDSWEIAEARVGIVKAFDGEHMPSEMKWKALTFRGETKKEVMPGEFFSSDPVKLTLEAGQDLCLELCYRGRELPCHEESVVPSFLLEDGKWVPSTIHPAASMIGCKREVKERVAFWGDSITQGLGTQMNTYTHWNAVAAEKIGTGCSFWNLGIGYGRADDAATNGSWMFKAKQADVIVVCFGVNDIMQGLSEECIRKDLETIFNQLKKAGKKVLIQTIPPFDYEGERLSVWKNLNAFIRDTLAPKADGFFDNVPILGKSPDEPQKAVFGGHPDKEGCLRWGEALAPELKKVLA